MSRSIADDLFASRSVGSDLDGVTMILHADTSQAYSMSGETFDANTPGLSVYAERVSILTDITLNPIPPQDKTIAPASRNLVVSCNSIGLGSDAINININGPKGLDDKGGDGTKGGSITFCVESLDYDQLGHFGADGKPVGIFFNAYGGRGGTGTPGIDEGKGGGNGGRGGDGGTVTLCFGNSALTLLTRLSAQRPGGESWIGFIGQLSNMILPDLVATYESFGFLSKNSDEMVLTVRLGLSLRTALLSLSKNLSLLVASGSKASVVLQSSIEHLQTTITTFQENQDFPDLTAGFEKRINDLNKQIGAFLASPSAPADAVLIQGTQDLSFGGQPGAGDPNVKPPPVSGRDGTDGTASAHALLFSQDDTSVGCVLAQSDQCQMLLNQADGFFFSNDPGNLSKAALLYQQIATRTAFVNSTAPSSSTSRAADDETPMFQAYDKDEARGLTVNPIPQLQNIQQLARARLNQILSGRDLFGHDPNWGPRLSFYFYQQQYIDLAKSLDEAEQNYEKYMTALAASDARDYLTGAAAAAQSRMGQSQAQIDMITAPNGPFNTSGFQVGLFTPLLRDKRAEIQAQVQRIEWDINNSLDLSPSVFINALSSIAIAPTEFNASASLLSAGYTALTNVNSINGQPVNKSNIVSQIGQCGDTIQSLTEGYSVLANGGLQVDDPGAGKLISTVDSLKSLLNQFKSAIPSSDSAKLSKDLDDYVSLITQRNTAVLTYNACLHLWVQAQADLEYYTKQHQNIATKFAQSDPSMPTIVFYMKKAVNDLKLHCLRLLNYGAHALRFWGTVDTPITFELNNALPDSAALASVNSQLNSRFEACLDELASGISQEFPGPQNAVKLGKFYHLTDGELTSLKHGVQDPDRKGKLMYTAVLRNIRAAIRGDESTFADCANVRATQVRVWLPGAKVNPALVGLPPILTIDMIQYGNETVVPSGWSAVPVEVLCNHSGVSFPFVYSIEGVNSIADVATATNTNSQDLTAGAYTGGMATTSVLAPIGPFADWRITVRETANPGLDLSGVQNAYVEFWISYVNFQASSSVTKVENSALQQIPLKSIENICI
ncbi:hypothetical protein ABW20_dc0109483 [Dactylellina cionopaga]|nr:hypothetical protein ABW20_dc0109483 [Dactylellina cionopaga]